MSSGFSFIPVAPAFGRQRQADHCESWPPCSTHRPARATKCDCLREENTAQHSLNLSSGLFPFFLLFCVFFFIQLGVIQNRECWFFFFLSYRRVHNKTAKILRQKRVVCCIHNDGKESNSPKRLAIEAHVRAL